MLEKKEDSIDTGVYGSSIYGIEKKQFPYILCITNMLLHNIDTPQIFHDNALMRDVLDYTEDDQFDVILMNPPYGGSEKSDVKNHFPADLSSSETADLFMAVILYRLKEDGRAGVVIPDSFLSGVDNAKTNIKTKMFAEFNVHTIIRLPGSCFAPYTPIATNIIFFDKTGPTHETWFYRFDLINDQKFSMRKNPITLEKLSAIKEWWNDRKEISDPTEDDSEPKTWKAKKIGIETIKENEYDLSFCGYPVAEKVVLSPKDTIDAFLSEQKEISDLFDRKIKEIQTLLGE
jgi:type I restriction enzyme M protein